MPLLLILFLAALTLSAIILLKTYTHIPRKELKRRALGGDEVAALLFKAVTYEASLQILLWGIIGLGGAAFFVVLSQSVSGWVALVVSVMLIWLAFAWIPYTRVSAVGRTLAKIATSPLAWLLNHTYPVLHKIATTTSRYRVTWHTGLYEKEDILELLKQQKAQVDNRLSDEELRVIEGALTFSDKIVRDVLTPRKIVKFVSVDEMVGPVLLDELHKSGYSRFPVHEGGQDRIVGTLYLRDLLDKSTGSVRDIMNKKVYYIHDEDSLAQALHAFVKTHHHLFIVVNSFEDIIGVLSIEDVLEQIIRQPIVDEFDQYDDLRAVAQRQATKEHREHSEEVLE